VKKKDLSKPFYLLPTQSGCVTEEILKGNWLIFPLLLPYISLASALHMCKADAREKQARYPPEKNIG